MCIKLESRPERPLPGLVPTTPPRHLRLHLNSSAFVSLLAQRNGAIQEEVHLPPVDHTVPNVRPSRDHSSSPDSSSRDGRPECLPKIYTTTVTAFCATVASTLTPRHSPNATVVVGRGSMDVVKYGMPGRGSHSYFDKDLFNHVRAVELSPPAVGAHALDDRGELPSFMLGDKSKWQALWPFSAAVDVFEDGSVYAIPASGHLPGHIDLLCRTERTWEEMYFTTSDC